MGDTFTLEKGQRYDVEMLEHVGWAGPGVPADDVNFGDDYDPFAYFEDDGTYKGPDDFGVEPTFTDAA